MARPDRSEIFRKVSKDVEGMNAQQIAEKLANFSVEVGRKPNAIQKLTLKAFRTLLDKAEEKAAQEKRVAQNLRDTEQESIRQDEVLKGMERSLADAIQFLESLNKEPEWQNIKFQAGSSQITKAELVNWASNVTVRLNEKCVAICPDGDEQSKREIMLIESEFKGVSMEEVLISNQTATAMLNTAPRTREWSAMCVLSRVAQSEALSSISSELAATLHDSKPEVRETSDTSGPLQTLRPYIQNGYRNASNTLRCMITEIGGRNLIGTIKDLVTTITTNFPKNVFWKKIDEFWPTIQRSLDNAITMKPPQSVVEQIDRISAYLSTFSNVNILPKEAGGPETIFTPAKIEAMAKEMFEAVPRAIETSAVISEFPHYDRATLELGGMIFAREGKKTIFVD